MLCQPFFYAALLDVEYKPIINQKVVVTDWRSFFLSKKGKVIAELNEFGKGRKSVQVKFENGDVSKFNFFQLTAE